MTDFKTLLKDDDDFIIYVYRIMNEDTDYHMEVEVWAVASWFDDKEPDLDTNKPIDRGGPELAVHGSIKWDGCSNLNFGDGRCAVHWCGEIFWKRHCEMMMKLWELAKETIGRFDQ